MSVGVCPILSVGVCRCLPVFNSFSRCLMVAFVGICPHLLHIKTHFSIHFCLTEMNDASIESSHQDAFADSSAEFRLALFMMQCPPVQLFSERSNNRTITRVKRIKRK